MVYAWDRAWDRSPARRRRSRPTAGNHSVVVLVEGRAVSVVSTYFVSAALRLHSLAELIEFRCPRCDRHQECALLGSAGDELLCPGCFGQCGADGKALTTTEPL